MTTFTSDDREEEYKKILKETQALEKGLEFFKKLKGNNASPPHIVDSGASVMKDEPVAYINVEERKLEWAKPMTWHTPTIAQVDKIPLYIMPNAEPVAIRYDFDGYGYQYIDSGSGSDWLTRVDGEPLYTHPAKTLTDEEIREICTQSLAFKDGNIFTFARAILRKAQEK
jgi:hypothetical protein